MQVNKVIHNKFKNVSAHYVRSDAQKTRARFKGVI